MTKSDIAIVDDLQSDSKHLASLLRQWLNERQLNTEIHIFSDGDALLAAYQPERFCAIFLDILLGEEKNSGLEIARKLREKDENQVLIFVTTESTFALDGYSVQAFDFLIKPCTYEKIFSVMSRIHKQVIMPAHLKIKEGREIHSIPVNVVIYIATVNRLIEIHTTEAVFSTRMPLSEIAEQFPDADYFQNCYRGIYVNLDYVSEMEDTEFKMKNGEVVPISRYKRSNMREAYTKHLFKNVREGRSL